MVAELRSHVVRCAYHSARWLPIAMPLALVLMGRILGALVVLGFYGNCRHWHATRGPVNRQWDDVDRMHYHGSIAAILNTCRLRVWTCGIAFGLISICANYA
jgi:hypothetical protein